MPSKKNMPNLSQPSTSNNLQTPMMNNMMTSPTQQQQQQQIQLQQQQVQQQQNVQGMTICQTNSKMWILYPFIIKIVILFVYQLCQLQLLNHCL